MDLYDTLNVTTYLRFREQENVIAIEAWYWNEEEERSLVPSTVPCETPDAWAQYSNCSTDSGGVALVLRSALRTVLTTTDEGTWLTYVHGDMAFSPVIFSSIPFRFSYQAGGEYNLPHEHWNMHHYPSGWRLPGYTPHPANWSAAVRSVRFTTLESKAIRAIALVPHTPARFWLLACEPGNCSYVVDMGTEIQGGINVTFAAGVHNLKVIVSASEELNESTSYRTIKGVNNAADDGSLHRDVWTLREGRQTVLSREYIEARYWQIENAPEPPTHSVLNGWRVWYPYNRVNPNLSDGGDSIGPSPSSNASGRDYTTVYTSSSVIDEVFAFCRFTGRVGALDVNTDSNARQRDNCNIDSHITAWHQAAAAPAVSAPYRRRSTAFLFQPDARVRPFTEFKLFSIEAVHAYALDTGDTSLAERLFTQQPEWLAEYSLRRFIQSDGLVHKRTREGFNTRPPSCRTNPGSCSNYSRCFNDLIDHPPSQCDGYSRSINSTQNVSVPINAHVASVHRHLAALGRWVGRPEHEVQQHERIASDIARAISRFRAGGDIPCSADAPACFVDGQDSNGQLINSSSFHATFYPIGTGLLTPREALDFLPFFRAKLHSRDDPESPQHDMEPVFSAMASNFVLTALYSIAAAEKNSTEAADLAFDFITRTGKRSWLEMLAAGATMTTEHWVDLKNGTWSHPWSAGPARIIPQWMLGVRPLQRAWRRVAVHPQPGTRLQFANMSVPTLRGPIHTSFSVVHGSSFVLNLKLPGNTRAEVCLPTGVLAHGHGNESECEVHLTLDGSPSGHVTPFDRPGQSCLPVDVRSGQHQVTARCA
jgi:alpha-L-rhamnosidase